MDFREYPIDLTMSYFEVNKSLGFYLQDYYVKEWVRNSMLLLEVENVDDYFHDLKDKNLEKKFGHVKITDIKRQTWGDEFHMLDPLGVLWHFAQFHDITT